MKSFRLALAVTLAALLAPMAFAEVIWVVGNGNTLVSFNHTTPGTPLSTVAVTGLGSRETILGIDFRLANGGLVALTEGNRLYNINTSTGVATAIGTAGAGWGQAFGSW